jgi:UDPglucose 6-dehydrogenase
MLRKLYAPLSNAGPIVVMDSCSAELTKYTANAMLAMRISFMNEIANLAEKCGADADLVRRGIGYDARIGSKYIYPGPGFGGSCFTKDLYALIHTAGEMRSHILIARAVLEINEAQKGIPVNKLYKLLGTFEGKTVAVWGLAFKPLTDDIRDAPALKVIELLLKHGAKVRVHDPKAMNNVRKVFGDQIEYSDSHYQAAAGAHGVILMTEWREYRSPDFMYLKSIAPEVAVVDARNVWREEDALDAGIKYARIGRAPKGL